MIEDMKSAGLAAELRPSASTPFAGWPLIIIVRRIDPAKRRCAASQTLKPRPRLHPRSVQRSFCVGCASQKLLRRFGESFAGPRGTLLSLENASQTHSQQWSLEAADFADFLVIAICRRCPEWNGRHRSNAFDQVVSIRLSATSDTVVSALTG